MARSPVSTVTLQIPALSVLNDYPAKMSNSRAPARNGEAGDIPLGQSASTTAGLQQDNGRLLEINTDIEHQRGVLQAQNASLRGQLEFLQQHVTNLQAEVDGLRQVVTWHEGREQDVVYQAEANRVFGEQLTEQRSQLGHFEDSLDRREYLLVMREERVAAQEDVADAEEDQEDDAIAEHGVEQDEHAAMDRDRSVNWREAAVLGGQNVGTKRERDVDGESPRDAKRVKTEHDGSSAELEEQNKDCGLPRMVDREE